MNTISKLIFPLILVIMVAAGCEEHEVTARDYPRLHTLPPEDVSTTGAKFHAEIFYESNDKIIEYGFVWGESPFPLVGYNQQEAFTDDISSGKFRAFIDTTFKVRVTYYIRAYVKTANYTVYGKDVLIRIEE